tara:strand:- start:336 stop:542 length:207 start_codon:yes stop_codon:yes gene_type:complete
MSIYKINLVEASTLLAAEYLDKHFEGEIFVVDPKSDSTTYTTEAQLAFDEMYDYYWEKLYECGIPKNY